jgi:imidazolonepropionase-like amidohydrolase
LRIHNHLNFDTAMKKLLALLFALLAIGAPSAARSAPEIPGDEPKGPVAIIGGTIHVVSGPKIESGTILFDGGKIVAVGRNVDLPANTRKIDAAGKQIFPGLIETNTTLGLTEIDAVRATNDYGEQGQFNPNVKAQVAFNPDSELIPVTRANGVLTALSSPDGGIMPGRSAVMALDGWTWEDMTVLSPAALHVIWPRMSSGGRERTLSSIDETLSAARHYQKARSGKEPVEIDLRNEAIIDMFERRTPLFVHANMLQPIEEAVALAVRENLRLTIVGGYDAPKCAALLKKHGVSVIVGGTQRVPLRRHDPYDAPCTVPDELRRAGVQYCIGGHSRFSASNVRNLPYHAATAAAFGLPKNEALRAITLYPARILGVDDRLGSLEKGKDATLIVCDGDILQTPTHVEKAFIAGRPVDLSSRHVRLWQKYREKYRRQGAKK